jgi:hypothetical protein
MEAFQLLFGISYSFPVPLYDLLRHLDPLGNTG